MSVHPGSFNIQNIITIAILVKKKKGVGLIVRLPFIGRNICNFYKFVLPLLFKISKRSIISYN